MAWNLLLVYCCLLSERLVAVHLSWQTFNWQASSIWQDVIQQPSSSTALTACSTCQSIFLPSLSAVSEQCSTLRELVQSPSCWNFSACSCVSFLFDETGEGEEILSWIMRHWTEVLFVFQAKVSIGLLADVLGLEWQTHCHYLAFLIIKFRLLQ